jgi:hypothetical protein
MLLLGGWWYEEKHEYAQEIKIGVKAIFAFSFHFLYVCDYSII